ncbi:MAG: extracellular solute-binding protein [Brachybacterium sp.]|nr:extracellular solute-binding protein [Brachybacterium sp.]
MVDRITRRSALGAGAAATTALGLAACGGGGDTAEAPPESSEELSGSIVMWIYPLSDDASAESYASFVESFKEKYPNVEVEIVQQPWANREEQLTAAISGGNAPDVVYFNPDFVPRFAVEDLLVSLDDLREDWGSAFVPASLEAMTFEDTLFSAPVLMQASQTFANQKILDEIGMEGPTTWDELRAVGEAAKEKGYFLLEYNGEATLNHNYYMYLWQAGGTVLTEDMSAAAFNSAEGLEALEFIKEIVDNGWAPKEPISVMLPFEQTDLAQGKVAYSLGSNIGQVREILKDPLTVLPPMAKKEQVAIGSVGALSVFNTTEAPEAAAAWVHHLTEPDFIEFVCSEFTYYSPRTDVTGIHDDDEQVAEFEQYLDVVNSGIIHPQAREIIDVMKPEIQAVLLQGEDPQAALNTMETAVNELLERG